MTSRCVACGKPIVLVDATPGVISLDMAWVHVSWWANRTHRAIPPERSTPTVPSKAGRRTASAASSHAPRK